MLCNSLPVLQNAEKQKSQGQVERTNNRTWMFIKLSVFIYERSVIGTFDCHSWWRCVWSSVLTDTL